MSPISVSFYAEGNDADDIFQCYMETCPPLHKGDTVWLEETAHPSSPFHPDHPLPLGRYTIRDIQYTFCKHHSQKSITTFCGVEVVVKEVAT